ncbi:hypothetical protein HYX12_02630 [Candidatus Woesearchaeota archaeon]|nr:hypothetical protein [Candidatus Woesearchaeota archaeon]
MINKAYKDKLNLQRIKEILRKEHSILLFDFFSQETFRRIKQEIKKMTFKEEKKATKYSYKKAASKVMRSNNFLKIILKNKELQNTLSQLLKKQINVYFTAYKFTWKDYVILHDQTQEKPGVDIIFDLGSLEGEWSPSWGGAIRYVQGNKDLLSLPVQQNTLAIIKRKNINEQRFVQYVNHYAKGKDRVFFLMTLRKK